MSSTEATSPTSTTTRSPQKTDNDEVTDIIRNENGESKSREVSPKLVVGGRKYGRRSRPQSAVAFDSSQSDSDDDQLNNDRNVHTADKGRSKRVSSERIFDMKLFVVCRFSLLIRWKSSRSMRCRCQANGSQQTPPLTVSEFFFLVWIYFWRSNVRFRKVICMAPPMFEGFVLQMEVEELEAVLVVSVSAVLMEEVNWNDAHRCRHRSSARQWLPQIMRHVHWRRN